ncbi:MAG: hypothetical protein M0T81_10255 [Thermoplasmatales archaeon]|jgi:hypothetical protein|nr:hypothetical protein [Thermoplasmatales archaeon]
MENKILVLILSIVAIALLGVTFAVPMTEMTMTVSGQSTQATATYFGATVSNTYTSWSNVSNSFSSSTGTIHSDVMNGIAMITASLVTMILGIIFSLLAIVFAFVDKGGRTLKLLMPLLSVIFVGTTIGLFIAGTSSVASGYAAAIQAFSPSATVTTGLIYGAYIAIVGLIVEVIVLILSLMVKPKKAAAS